MIRIALRHRPGLMTEQPLDLVEIGPPLHQSCRERVPHAMKPEIGNPRPILRLTKLPYQEPHLKRMAQRRLEHRSRGCACGSLSRCQEVVNGSI